MLAGINTDDLLFHLPKPCTAFVLTFNISNSIGLLFPADVTQNISTAESPTVVVIMTNLIQDIRTDITKHFDENALLPNTEEIYFSPDHKHFFKANHYLQTDTHRNWTVTKIQIFQTDSNEKLFEFIRNDDSLFHGWLTVDNKSYLLLSEDIEGKSIYDLADRKFYSYSFDDDKFICCEYYPSPDGKKLAIVGCYWACPYELVVFDTSNPISFPYKELYRRDTFQEKPEWLDNTTLKIASHENDYKIVKVE